MATLTSSPASPVFFQYYAYVCRLISIDTSLMPSVIVQWREIP